LMYFFSQLMRTAVMIELPPKKRTIFSIDLILINFSDL